MKVLLINGSPHENGSTYTALSEVGKELGAHGIGAEFFQLGKKPINGCVACRKCKETGRCAFDDGANVCIDMINQADGLIIGSPVYFASANGALCALLDRVFYAGRALLRGKPAAAVVVCRRGGASTAFDRLNKYFTISGMPLASSQYWNSVHGNNPDEVRRDLEGMQVMRTLAKNIVWLLKNIENGKNTVSMPPMEERVSTNFIR